MSETRREGSGAVGQSEMPWVLAWRYAKSRAFAPRTPLYWAITFLGFMALEALFLDWSFPQSIGKAAFFVLGLEVVEFVRRFLSGPPVGEAGKEDY